MSEIEDYEDIILKGGALHEHLTNSGFSDFEVYDKNWSLDSTEEPVLKNNFFRSLLSNLPDHILKFLPAFHRDSKCYVKFLTSLLDSTVIRPEAEYWLRNLRMSFKVKNIGFLSPDDCYALWQSPFTWLIEKPLFIFFLCQGGVLAYNQIMHQQRLLNLKQLLAALEGFNRKLGIAMHLTQQDEMSQRFLSNTFSKLVDSIVMRNSPNGNVKLIDLLKRFSGSMKQCMDEMYQANPLPAEFDSRHALVDLGIPACFSDQSSAAHRDLKDAQLYYKEVLTIFTHQVAMNFIVPSQNEGSSKVENIFPALQEMIRCTLDASVELKQIVDLVRGVNLLKAPPKTEMKNGGGKRQSYFTNPLIPAIESSGMHLKNALSFVLDSTNVSDSGLGHALQTLQASRMELAAADSFLLKAEILINRLSKSKIEKADNFEAHNQPPNHQPLTLDLSSNLSEVGDPFLEEIYQGTSKSGSLEWDDGEEQVDDSHDSANNTYYKHLMNELQCVLVSKGRSRISTSMVTPSGSFNEVDTEAPSKMATSTPFVPARTENKIEMDSTIELDNSSTLSDSNRTIELVTTDSSVEESVRPTPKPRRSKYAAEKMEQMTYVSPATLNGESPIVGAKNLANLIAQRAQQMTHIEETFEDETVFEDAQDKTIELE